MGEYWASCCISTGSLLIKAVGVPLKVSSSTSYSVEPMMMALNKEEDLGGQNHGNSIVVGIGMIEWEVEAATTTAAATVPGWILVCELLQFNMGNVELPIQVSTCSLTHISPWMQ